MLQIKHYRISSNYLFFVDTSIAELIKEITVSDSFQEALQVEQDLLNGIDTDKICPFIEDFISKQEPIIKVIRFSLCPGTGNSYICNQNSS